MSHVYEEVRVCYLFFVHFHTAVPISTKFTKMTEDVPADNLDILKCPKISFLFVARKSSSQSNNICFFLCAMELKKTRYASITLQVYMS
jgi:hypothetical protein